MIKLLFDSVSYTQKPEGYEIGVINKRLTKSLANVTPFELAEGIKSGRTFVGSTLKKVNGEVNRRKENWESQTVVALDFDAGLTIEEALDDEFFKKHASFMYLTFSHKPTEHKFRVVFILETIITTYTVFDTLINQLLDMYPQADKACKDGVRLYFGGTEYYPFDFDNRLPINLESNQKGFWSDIEYISYMSDQKPNHNPKPIVQKRTQQHDCNNVDLIRGCNHEALKKILNAPKVVFSNHNDAVDYAKQYDLIKFLGLSRNNFNDLFHHDNTPSASIFISSKGSNHYMYKCHSASHEFSGTIINVVSKLQNKKEYQVHVFIFKCLNIELKHSQEVIDKIKILENNLSLIESTENLEALYPKTKKVLKSFGFILASLLTFAKQQINVIDNKIITYPSTKTLESITNKSNSTVNSHINFLVLMGFLEKCNEKNIPAELLEKLKNYQSLNNYKYMTSVYVIPEYTSDLLSKTEVIADKWFNNGCTIKTVNHEGIKNTFGIDEANRVFPQNQNKPTHSLNEIVADKLERVLRDQIQIYGYTTESIVLAETMLFFIGQKKFKQEQLKRCISEFIDKYSLVRVSLNKQLKDKLGAECKGYPKVLLKDDYYNQIRSIE